MGIEKPGEMEKKLELLSKEITLENLKKALSELNKDLQFAALQKKLSKLNYDAEGYEKSRKEAEKSGMSQPVIIEGEKECLEEKEKIQEIIFIKIFNLAKGEKKEDKKSEEININDALSSKGEGIFMTEEQQKEAGPADHSGEKITDKF